MNIRIKWNKSKIKVKGFFKINIKNMIKIWNH